MPREHRRTWGQGLGVLPAFLSKPREKLPTFTPAQSSPETRNGVEMLGAARNFFFFFFSDRKRALSARQRGLIG